MTEKSPDNHETERLQDENDMAKVKFIPDDKKGTSGDAKVNIEGVETQFVGLTKEELMKFANDPFWVRLRMLLFILFWIVWVAMLVGAIFIIVVWPKCASPPPLKWYQEEPLYQIDLDAKNGPNELAKTDKILSNVEALGASAIVLNPILMSSENLTLPRPNIGTVDEVADFIVKAKEKGIRVVLEIDSKQLKFGGVEETNVVLNGMRFWLEKGVGGFSMINAEAIPKTAEANPPSDAPAGRPSADGVLSEMRRLIDGYQDALFMVDTRQTGFEDHAERFFGTPSRPLAHLLTTHELAVVTKPTADKLVEIFTKAQNTTPAYGWPAFVISDRQGMRLGDRVSPALVDAIHMVSTMGHGTPVLQHGDEYGLKRGEELPETGGGNTTETTQHHKHFAVYQAMTKLRKDQNALRQGTAHIKALSTDIFAMSRVRKGSPGFLVVVNLSDQVQVVNLQELGPHIPESGHADVVSSNSLREIHHKLSLTEFEMVPEESVVIQFVPKFA